MTLILDYSFARPSPVSIKAAGYSGVVRYLSTDSHKNLSVPERDGLFAQGLSISLVWETTAGRAGEGAAAGAQDAIAADSQADALGYPARCPIFFAVDYDTTPSVVKAYFAAVTKATKRPVGVYGGIRIVEGVDAPFKWQACAWSAGKVSPKAHLYQRLKATVSSPIPNSDENMVCNVFPVWTKVLTPSDAVPVVVPKPAAPKPWTGLAVDGVFGPATKQRLQRWAGVAADGILGRLTWTAIQRKVGAVVDGLEGPKTWACIQRTVGGCPVDGILGPLTVRRLQAYLNARG